MSRTLRPVRLGPLLVRGDCLALAILVGGWSLFLAAASTGTARLGDPAGTDPGRMALVAEHIDPNTASVGSLRRLPMIGPVKAQAIVDFRRAARAAGRQKVFRWREDLTKVPGIGPETVERSAEYLALPARPASSRP